MKFQVLKDAEDELTEAVEYYEEIEPGLGIALKEEARTVLQWIRNNHAVPRVRPKGYRRVNLKVFSYYVAYFVWSDTIWILCVAHARRRPEYWLTRRKKIV
jgi:toxin ParE1/3/4